MHQNIISVLEKKEFTLFLSTRNNLWNVIWIYNLDKIYSAKEFNQSFIKQVNNWNIENNFKILEDTFLADKKIII
jgi:predicted Zn-dependent protease